MPAVNMNAKNKLLVLHGPFLIIYFNRTLSITAIFLANTFCLPILFCPCKRIQNYWEKYYFRDLDVVIIGAKYCWSQHRHFAAWKNPGLRILILERSPIPYGADYTQCWFCLFWKSNGAVEWSWKKVRQMKYLNYLHVGTQAFNPCCRELEIATLVMKNWGHKWLTSGSGNITVARSTTELLYKWFTTGISHYFNQRNDLLASLDLKGFTQCIYFTRKPLDPMLMFGSSTNLPAARRDSMVWIWRIGGSRFICAFKNLWNYHFNNGWGDCDQWFCTRNITGYWCTRARNQVRAQTTKSYACSRLLSLS